MGTCQRVQRAVAVAVCMHVCMYVCTHVRTYVRTYTNACILYVCKYVRTSLSLSLSLSVCVFVFFFVCIFPCVHYREQVRVPHITQYLKIGPVSSQRDLVFRVLLAYLAREKSPSDADSAAKVTSRAASNAAMRISSPCEGFVF